MQTRVVIAEEVSSFKTDDEFASEKQA